MFPAARIQSGDLPGCGTGGRAAARKCSSPDRTSPSSNTRTTWTDKDIRVMQSLTSGHNLGAAQSDLELTHIAQQIYPKIPEGDTSKKLTTVARVVTGLKYLKGLRAPQYTVADGIFRLALASPHKIEANVLRSFCGLEFCNIPRVDVLAMVERAKQERPHDWRARLLQLGLTAPPDQ